MDLEAQETKQARQRASVKWLLSKAFNNRIPDNLKEPFYRDHESQEHLKPQIVVGLGNATLYCQTLSNLYSDPNYQSLNHWSILQTLARKGVAANETSELPLTETVLIQTNPLRVNAHMSVIESLMVLYSKEISSGDRISNSLRRISGTSFSMIGLTNEQSLLLWVSHVCAALKKRIDQEIENGATDENGARFQALDISPVRDFQDLCDGVCLALLISYYCPKVIPWTCVRINYLPAVEDSIHNVLLVSNFSQKHLPYSVFHMTPEDITYMRGSMKQNLIVLLADLFNLFEIHPAKCVCYPGMGLQVVLTPSDATTRRPTPPNDCKQMNQNIEPYLAATSADEGDSVPAGRPSNWEQHRRPSFAGRRSRRNSSSEDSQLTIENFGGSQDHINMIERAVERERKSSTASMGYVEPVVAARSSVADACGTLKIGYDTDSGSEKQDRETEKYTMRREKSMENVSLRNNMHSSKIDLTEGNIPPVNKNKNHPSSTDHVEDENTMGALSKRNSSFVKLPTKTTTWQKQSVLLNHSDNNGFRRFSNTSFF